MHLRNTEIYYENNPITAKAPAVLLLKGRGQVDQYEKAQSCVKRES
jgi:hypothetical protein